MVFGNVKATPLKPKAAQEDRLGLRKGTLYLLRALSSSTSTSTGRGKTWGFPKRAQRPRTHTHTHTLFPAHVYARLQQPGLSLHLPRLSAQPRPGPGPGSHRTRQTSPFLQLVKRSLVSMAQRREGAALTRPGGSE